MKIPTLTQELRFAQDIAQEAGRLVMSVYATDFGFADKGGGEGPVTEADRRSNDYIVAAIRRAFPADGVIAEESEAADDWRRPRCWYVDPLDGTREFISRNGEFAVQIGLTIAGEARLGVVYKPADSKLYSGIVEETAATLQVGGVTRELHVSSVSVPSEARMLVSRSHKSKRAEAVRLELGIQHVIESGSVGVKCGLLAEGLADLYIHPSTKSSRWDSCAPEAFLRAAGGRFTTALGDQYRYDTGELNNPHGILAANPALYDLALPVVREVMLAG